MDFVDGRDLPFGPSDEPCPMESSTAHNVSSFWESSLSREKTKFHGGSSSISDHDHSRLLSIRPSPEMDSPSQASMPSLTIRRILFLYWPTKLKLGFHLAGILNKLDPSTSMKSKTIRKDPALNAPKPRSRPLTLLSSFNQHLCRFQHIPGRRLRLREKPLSVLGLCNNVLRILVLVSSLVMFYESKSLKISIIYCSQFQYVGMLIMVMEVLCPIFILGPSYPMISSTSQASPSYITPKIWNQYSQEVFDGHRRDLNPLICDLKQSSPDYAEALLQVDFLASVRSPTWPRLST